MKTFDPIATPLCRSGITDSAVYLEKVLEKITEKFPNFSINNLVISLEGKFPKLAPKHENIQENIARLLGLEIDQVGLTYTTGEELTDFGKGLGLRCLVQILVNV